MPTAPPPTNAAEASSPHAAQSVVASTLALLLLLALIGLIAWASLELNVVDGSRWLLSTRWGVVTVLDVYAGAFVVAVWMRATTRSTAAWLAWVVALLCLGHAVSLAYLLTRLARGRSLARAFSGA